jgi:O-antigen ligase
MLFLVVTLSLGWYFGWDLLSPRLDEIGKGYESREEMYKAAEPMAADYPWFGTGPGTFATVFQLYRYSEEVYWPGQLHNDWLETRITFGWLGLGLLCAALAVVGLRWFTPGGMLRGGRRLGVLAWLGLGGCLIHALFDFPFQVHSTLFLFLVICAMLFNLSRR